MTVRRIRELQNAVEEALAEETDAEAAREEMRALLAIETAPHDEMRRLLNPTNVPDFEACATTGQGVFETLKAVAKGVLTDLKKLGK